MVLLKFHVFPYSHIPGFIPGKDSNHSRFPGNVKNAIPVKHYKRPLCLSNNRRFPPQRARFSDLHRMKHKNKQKI